MQGRISEFFAWDEVLSSETADRLAIDNVPLDHMVDVLRATAARMDRLRRVLNVPVLPSSWYRSPGLNCVIGGAARRQDLDVLLMHRHDVVRSAAGARIRSGKYGRHLSQHVAGQAVDFRAPDYGTPSQVFDYLRPLMVDLGIDQLIIEHPASRWPWVHVSFSDGPRHEALVIDHDGTRLA
jgi:hypothetical protein